ncbi:MAG TPA: hypothetical protein VJ023_10675 [Pyrinomonadaceae bacterium]|nr:hypothetical protein [Pyrinomonadaceae bacterium]
MTATPQLKIPTFLLVLFLLWPSTGTAQTPTSSIYSDLRPARCRTIEVDRETGSSVQQCRGVGGYKLLVLDDDSRQSIDVIDAKGKKHELRFWEVVTLGFSTLGDRAEWRVNRRRGQIVPLALIVRVNAQEDAEHPERKTSYLAVARLQGDTVCVTHKIPAARDANQKAREAADASSTAPCLPNL